MSTALLALFAVILCILFRILNVNSAPQRPHLVCKDQSFLSTVLKIAPVIAEPMPDHDRRKRSRSRSKDDHRHRHKQRREQKFTNMQNQLDNLRKAIETLVQVQKEQRPANQSTEIETDNIEIIATTNVEEKKDLNTEVIGGSIQEKQSSKDISEEPTLRDNVLKVLGVDLNESKFKDVKYHPELKNTWSKWMKQGLPEKNKKEIIELYNRKGDLYTEAPKINLEIVPLLSEMAKKRDEHFLETQNCVGTALAALGAAISMLIDSPEEGLDEDVFTDYLSHAGQILTDVFHQQSVVRKSFITPQLNKNIKPTVDAMISDEWLYGNNLKEKVKDAKEIEKACAEIKDKAQQKNSSKSNRGNSKYPPANYRQVGYQQKHRQFRFKKRISQNLTQSLFKRNSDEPIVIQEISQRQEPSISPPPFIGGRQIIRTAFLRKGVSEDSVDVIPLRSRLSNNTSVI